MIIIKKLGRGSEGIVYQVRDSENHMFVLKEYSTSGLRFRDNTIRFLNLDIRHPSLYRVSITDGLCIYPFEELTEIKKDNFKSSIEQISDLQSLLLKHGVVYWDLGIISPNFMLYKETLRLIDYGGFLFLNDTQSYPSCWLTRTMSDNTFRDLHYVLRLTTLAFIIKYGIGIKGGPTYYKKMVKYPQRAKQILQAFIAEGLVKQELVDVIMNSNLLTTEGWTVVGQVGDLV